MKKLLLVSIALLLLGSCRVMDFTVISSKNVTLNVNKDHARVQARSLTIKGATDKAIEKAGAGYDALIDGVVYQSIFGIYKVVGTPIKTSEHK